MSFPLGSFVVVFDFLEVSDVSREDGKLMASMQVSKEEQGERWLADTALRSASQLHRMGGA
jgi:hypothetical protein